MDNLGEQVGGVAPPRSFILDAAILNYEEEVKIIREDIKRNRILFEFPNGVNRLDLLEECRALTLLEDFEAMFDITVQLLVGKDLAIYVKDDRGGKHEVCHFVVTDRQQDWRSIEFIDKYPVVVTWLSEFVAAWLLKKYPEPGKELGPQQARENLTTAKTKKKPNLFQPKPAS